MLGPAVGGDVCHMTSDSEVTGRVGGIADGDGYTGIPLDVAHLLVGLDRIDDHVGSPSVSTQVWVVCGEPSAISVVMKHGFGPRHELDEAVRKIHSHDDSAA